MKKLLLFLLPLLLTTKATGQAERVFVKSINLIGRQTVLLNIGDNVQTIPTDNDVVRVQMTVKVSNTNDATLKAIAETGRYMLKTDFSVQDVTLSVPGLQRELKLNGNSLNETVTYIVFVPKNIQVLLNTDNKAKVVARLNP
jgi:hypothetical protein